MNIIRRIVKWNSIRYTQEINWELAESLLREEVEELFDGFGQISDVKETVDIIFVCIGILWKLGLSEQQIEEVILAVCDSNDTKPKQKLLSNTKGTKGSGFIPAEFSIKEILNRGNHH